MLFQVVEPRLPELPIWLQPLLDGAQRLGADSVEAALGVGSDFHEARLSQNAQMLGDRRLADRQLGYEVTHRPLRYPQQVQDAPPVGFRKDLERSLQGIEYS